MYLTHLSLTNFRNYARLDVDVPLGTVLLVGDNAQGKTGLLEAVFFLSTFTSFHANSDRQLINFLAARDPLVVSRITADFCRVNVVGTQSIHRLEVRIIQETNGFNGVSRVRKSVLLDGVEKKVSGTVGMFNSVIFLPQTLRVVEGSPEVRRRYLNLTLAQVMPNYALDLSTYNKALTQRNALLKQIYEGKSESSQLEYWDDQLTDAGAGLIFARIQALKELEGLASASHRDLTRGDEVLRISYAPAYDPLPHPSNQYSLPLVEPLDRSSLSIDRIKHGFLEDLKRLRAEEIARGITTIGPHRDDFRFLGNGVDLGVYGSRGQARTALLALKLAEVIWMKEKTGQWPVLLLDEVLAELDVHRRADLLSRIAESEQSILTTTDLDLFSKEFLRGVALWQIKAGQVNFIRDEKEE